MLVLAAILAVSSVLNADSVDINNVNALRNLDSVLTTHQVVVTDTPTIIIQTCNVPMDTLKAAFLYARLYLRGREAEAAKLPGYERCTIVREHPEEGKVKVYVLMNHTEGNLPELMFRNTGQLGVLELTYITEKGKAIAVEKL